MNPQLLFQLLHLSHEHPQTIALITGYLPELTALINEVRGSIARHQKMIDAISKSTPEIQKMVREWQAIAAQA